MKKRLIAMLLVIAAAFTSVAFAAENEKVEISFKVGDSILTVNGQPLEVTAPYIAGDGTTLVPVRVITEAFGAQVDWDGTTQSVSLKYADDEIEIKIGSKTATVNGATQELLEAPQLNNGTTMVPLRFISETFGAEVTYDDGLITVTKTTDEKSTITNNDLDSAEYIGDSYYGWSMKNPRAFRMIEKELDCRFIEFYNVDENGNRIENEDKNYISVTITDNSGEFNVDGVFDGFMKEFEKEIVPIAEKETMSDGSTRIRFRVISQQNTVEMIFYIKGNRSYFLKASARNDTEMELKVNSIAKSAKNKEEMLAEFASIDYEGKLGEVISAAESFSLSEQREIYDLSTAVDGYREFTTKSPKTKMLIPADWTKYENDEVIGSNEFAFLNINGEYISVSAYVDKSGEGAKGRIETMLDKCKKADYEVFEEISSKSVNGNTYYSFAVGSSLQGMTAAYTKFYGVSMGEDLYIFTYINVYGEYNSEDAAKVDKMVYSFTAE